VPKSVFKRSKTYTHCCNRSIWTSSPPVQVSSNVVCAEISNERQVQSDWKVLRRRILIALCYYRSCPCSKQAAGPVYHGPVRSSRSKNSHLSLSIRPNSTRLSGRSSTRVRSRSSALGNDGRSSGSPTRHPEIYGLHSFLVVISHCTRSF
jgi:hypothetical protein